MAGLVGRTLGRYEIGSLLGAGGMGSVYRARDVKLKRDVAIKVISEGAEDDPGRRKRFDREIRIVAGLSHPNILEIKDFGHVDGISYAVMELLKGRDLREMMRRHPLPVDRALEIGIAVAYGLRAAHHQGVLHRDIKPENIFVTSDGDVKILDFGVARLVAPSESAEETVTFESSLTTPGTVIGTTAYMSPEQVRGQALDHRSDIFSLGCVLYEMFSGAHPFRRETCVDTMSAILNDEPKPISESRPDLPPAVELIIGQCLRKDPEERYDSARDVAYALQALSLNRSTGSVPLEQTRGVPRRIVRNAAYIALGGVTIAFGVWLTLRLVSEDQAPIRYQPRQVTSTPGYEAEPAVSPDGSLIAYASNQSGNSDIWLVGVHGGNPLQLTDHPADDRDPTWFPDGAFIAFESDRDGEQAVYRVPVLGGPAVRLIGDATDPAVSPDGRRLAFSRAEDGGFERIAVVDIDGDESPTTLTDDGDGLWDHENPAWSPDGKQICYADFRDLWLVDVGGDSARRLTTDHSRDMDPVFSPDGRFVYFSSAREGTTALWRVPLTGATPQRVTIGTGPETSPTFSGDGNRIAYSTFLERRDVVVLDRTRGTYTRFPGERSESSPDVAPDGSGIVFVSNRLGKFDLWLQPIEDGLPLGAPRQLTDHAGSLETPRYSGDGEWIAYFRVVDGQRDVWVIPSKGGMSTRFTEDPSIDVHPAISPDGSRLVFVSDRGGVENLWMAPIADGRRTGEVRRVTDSQTPDMFPAWSPDGDSVAFLRDEDVWAIEVDSDLAARRITSGALAHQVRWEPDGRHLLVSGSWDTGRVELRRVETGDGSSEPLDPPVVFGDLNADGIFSSDAEGRIIAYIQTETGGDVWVMERIGGS